jgi:DNA repair exonuclease SbcCD ATPase subunit
MNIERVEIKNFMGFGEAAVDFDFSNIVLIDGKNLDSSSAQSNGAGKSSIYEAIYWCLFGKTKRGLTGDSVINNAAKKNCSVSLQFSVAKGLFNITRYRKDKTLGNHLSIEKLEPKKGTTVLTKGTVKDTQELLNEIIGMSELTFLKMTSFGQGDIKPFADLSDAELKQVFEQALGLSILSESHDKLKKKRSAMIRKKETLDVVIEKLQGHVDHYKEILELNETALKEERDSIKERKKEKTEEILKIDEEIKLIKEEIARLDVSVKAKATQLAKEKKAQEILLEKKKELTELNRAIRDSVVKADSHVEYASNFLVTLIDKVKNAKELVGTECGECGKEYKPEDIEQTVESLATTLREAKDDLTEKKEAADKLKDKESEIASGLKKIEAALDKFEHIATEAAAINGDKIESSRLNGTIDVLHKKKITLTEELAYTKSIKEEELEEKVATYKEKISEANSDISEKTEVGLELESEVGYMDMLESVLGNGGLKTYIFDNITPELNKTIAEYMNVINPDIEVEIDTFKKLKSGDIRDKFSINVANATGANEYKGNSGGEQQIINLVISLAANVTFRSLMSGAVNVLFLDEPFENLDDSISENVVELCQRFSSSVDNLFLVSHNQGIKDLVADTLIVEKSGGYSTIK